MDDALYQNILKQLKCPACFNYMVPPIRQCPKGHNICNLCRSKKCPSCGSLFTETRNLSLESIATRVEYPCTNQGCSAKLALRNLDYHKKNCEFIKYKCGFSTCHWSGPRHEIVDHWVAKILRTKLYKENNVCQTKIESKLNFVNLISANNELYYFKCKIFHEMICFTVQYIGHPDNAESYYYEIEILKAGRPRKTLLLRDYCQSIDLDDDALFKSEGSSCVNLNLLDKYIGPKKTIVYNLRVCVNGNEKK